MHTIRLFREVKDPGNRGPSRGMWALQRALLAANIPWLKIGSLLHQGEIPWLWNYQDAKVAVQFSEWGWPFIIGPNVMFQDSRRPARGAHELRLLDSESCVMQFTESEWYAALIREHCDHNEAPIVLWSYPIDPQPEGPLPAEYDLLIYLKDMSLGREAIRAQKRWQRSNLVVYGQYERSAMIDLARRSRFALYLSTDDRGPLAASEIALAGCPLVGIERGCPWVKDSRIGVQTQHFGQPNLDAACEEAIEMDRNSVRDGALDKFSTDRTIATIREALEPIAMGE